MTEAFKAEHGLIHATLENKVALARLLQQHRGHAIRYFGVRSAESLSGRERPVVALWRARMSAITVSAVRSR